MALSSAILAAVACSGSGGGGGGGGGTSQPASDKLPVSFSPSFGTPLLTTDTLTVTFPRAVDTTTVSISPGGGTWNTADTVYTFPALTAGMTTVSFKTVDAATQTKNIDLNVSFNVYDPTSTPFLYVSGAGSDSSGTGTITAPFATIGKGIATAVSGQAVLVAAGTYQVDSGSGTGVVIKDGVSLYGGYDASFAKRDPWTNITTIQDLASTAAATPIVTDYGTTDSTCGAAAAGTPMAAVSIGLVASPLQIDGFTIKGATASATVDSAAISDNNTSANVFISNSVLNGGAGSAHSVGLYSTGTDDIALVADSLDGGTSAGMSMGLYQGRNELTAIYSTFKGGSAPINAAVFSDDFKDVAVNLSHDVVDGGSGTTSYGYYGVPNCPNETYPNLDSNTITGGSGTTSSAGVHSQDWVQVLATNNTIDGGTGPTSVGAEMLDEAYGGNLFYNNTISGGAGTTSSMAINIVDEVSSSGAVIKNNILFTTGAATTRVCVSVDSTTTQMPVVMNNDLFNCPTALYVDGPSSSTATNLTDPVTLQGGATTLGSAGNVSSDPAFLSSTNWHLTSHSPAEVQQGGLVLSWVTMDLDGVTRTASLTMTPANVGAAGISMGAY